MQVLGLRRNDTAAWVGLVDEGGQLESINKKELLALAAACPGANGGGLKLVTVANEPLSPFDDDDHTASLARYVPEAFGRVRGDRGYPL